MTARRKRRPTGPAPASSPARFSLASHAPLALVLAGAVAVHVRALRAPFFTDDYLFLDQVRDRGLFAALLARDPIGNFLRPVGRQLHFWLWSHVSGESSVVFHAVNLALFLGAVVLLYELTRRVAGRGPAIVAAAFVALHYAADVPVLWASGSQDLIALAGSLGAVLLAAHGRGAWAAAAFAAAILSKETAAGVPLLCLIAGHRADEPLLQTARRQAPVLAVFAAWAAWWAITLPTRGAVAPTPLGISGIVAALTHLPQVALGVEWRADHPLPALALPLAWVAAAAGGLAAWWGAGIAHPSRRAWLLGGAFALVGAVPVMVVASIWSAYFYLLALCGVGLLLGLAVGRSRRAAAVVVVLLAFASANARATTEFSTEHTPWTRLSHVNRYYLNRAMGQIDRYLHQLKRLHPTLPARSTLFFGNFPMFVGWQAADGPLVRWAYRDSSLRSYFASSFTRARAERGPYFFFVGVADSLREEGNRPALLQNMWFTRMMNQQWQLARETMEMALPEAPDPAFTAYWLAWACYAQGDTGNAYAILRRIDIVPARGPSPAAASVERAVAAGDTTAAIRLLAVAVGHHALDPWLHSRLTDLMLPDRDRMVMGSLEAVLTTVLAPSAPKGWRRLAAVQMLHESPEYAERSLQRYYELGGAEARDDTMATVIERVIRSTLPGGSRLQRAIRD